MRCWISRRRSEGLVDDGLLSSVLLSSWILSQRSLCASQSIRIRREIMVIGSMWDGCDSEGILSERRERHARLTYPRAKRFQPIVACDRIQ